MDMWSCKTPRDKHIFLTKPTLKSKEDNNAKKKNSQEYTMNNKMHANKSFLLFFVCRIFIKWFTNLKKTQNKNNIIVYFLSRIDETLSAIHSFLISWFLTIHIFKSHPNDMKFSFQFFSVSFTCSFT